VPHELRFAAIYSNPPIRVGKEALHELLATWLGRLEPSGAAWLVVNRHLGGDSLAAWLGTQGFAVARQGSKSGYRILRVGFRPEDKGSAPAVLAQPAGRAQPEEQE
jgi:16S rRNA (guanine1207-N2)-methyltransferase